MPSDRDAVAALERNAWTMFSILGIGDGGRITDTPTRLVVEAPISQPPYNGVWRFYDEGDRSLDAQAAELLESFAERGVAPIWMVHPTSSRGIRRALSDHGMACAEELPGMIADLRGLGPIPPIPEGVEVMEATPAESDAWLHLVSWRYGLDRSTSPYLRQVYAGSIGSHSRLWIARIGGEPVSKVVMHVDGGVAGIYGVVTTEGGRKRGLATILTLTALHTAREGGVGTSVLHSTPMARSLYRRLGYRDVAPFEVWAAPETLHL